MISRESPQKSKQPFIPLPIIQWSFKVPEAFELFSLFEKGVLDFSKWPHYPGNCLCYHQIIHVYCCKLRHGNEVRINYKIYNLYFLTLIAVRNVGT